MSGTLTSSAQRLPQTIEPASASPTARLDTEYQPFPGEDGRDWRQQHIEIPLMLWLMKLPRHRRVLEIGCGRGVALPVLARRLAPLRLVGVDIAFSFLCEARERVRAAGVSAELIWADARDLPFEDASFDVVIDFGTLFHISRSANGLAQIGRVLAPEGVFVTETRVSQLLSHPVRSRGRSIPWEATSLLAPARTAWLWESRKRIEPLRGASLRGASLRGT
ncbi:MAG: class I SAM-dependent methyltransferase [Gemmatimonadetes bacterium]|nr:class I SAM-dependent methyltransferase [Gemmatimonadota bacterium]